MSDSAQNDHKDFLTSEKIYKLIYEISPEAIIIVDTKGKFVRANDRMFEWLGFERAEIIGKYFMDAPILPTLSKTKVMKVFTERLLGKDIAPYELEFKTKDGDKKIGLIRGTTIKDENNNVVGDLVLAADITDQVNTERQFKAVLNTSPDSITITDLEGNITFASDQALKLHGYDKPEEMIGRNALDFIDKKDKDKAKQNLEKTLEEGSVKGVIYKMIKKEGSSFYGDLSASVILDTTGDPKSFMATVRDVTERIKSEEELKKKSEELERLNKHMIGREIRMAELKEKLENIKSKSDE